MKYKNIEWDQGQGASPIYFYAATEVEKDQYTSVEQSVYKFG